MRDTEIVGIIVFNDHTTKMEVVVDILCNEFALEKTTAINLMLKVHDRGFSIIETLPRQEAHHKLAKAQSAIGHYAPDLILRIIEDPCRSLNHYRLTPVGFRSECNSRY